MNRESINLTGSKILIVDDQPATVHLLRQGLESQGYRILYANSGEKALEHANRLEPDLILLDVMMPGIDGLETCRRLKENESTQDIPIVFITAHNDTERVISGFKAGGVDYITKPFETEEVLIRVKTHLENNKLTKLFVETNIELAASNRELQQEIHRREQAEDALRTADEYVSIISQQEAAQWGVELIAKSQAMAEIVGRIRRLHDNDTTSVLITGESGTGKEMIARAVHFGGPRAEKRFLAINCAAVSNTLAESEFFGHVRGAFTGANHDRKGYFEVANGGTLFLDEVGEMPLELQAKLLRTLEDGKVMPVGGTDEKPVDVRIMAATNANLQAKIADKSFREDLYHRLAVFPILLPPLRERKEDIPLLVSHFLAQFAAKMRREKPKLSEKALAALTAYPFPGNIRELLNIIERALIESGGETIEPKHLHIAAESEAASDSVGENSLIGKIFAHELGYSDAVTTFQRQMITQVLSACGGNGYEAAKLLRMHRPNLTRLIKRLKIDESKS